MLFCKLLKVKQKIRGRTVDEGRSLFFLLLLSGASAQKEKKCAASAASGLLKGHVPQRGSTRVLDAATFRSRNLLE